MNFKNFKPTFLMAVIFAAINFCISSNGFARASSSVEIVELNPISAWLYEDNSLPIVLINIEFMHSGSAYETKAGTTQILANMLIEGAGKYDADAFNEELDNYAIIYGANAGRDSFSIQLKTLRENLPKAMELLQASLFEPHFSQQDLTRIKAEQIAKISTLNESPEFQLQQLFHQTAFAQHPYSNNPYGDSASIQSISPTDLQQFMRSHFTAKNIKISVAGDVDNTVVKNEILRPVIKISQQKLSSKELSSIQIKPRQEKAHYEMNIPQTSIMLIYQGIKRDSPLFYAGYILQHILGGSSLSSELGQKLREEHGLVYGVSAGFENLDYANWFSVNFATKTSQTKFSQKLAREVIAKIADGNIDGKQLQEAKDYLVGTFALATNSNAKRLQYIAMMQHYGLGVDYLQKRNQLIEKVSLQQLKQAAKILQGEPILIVEVGKN